MKKEKEHIGNRIKKIRTYKGFNQEDLAKAIGKTRSLISHLERTGNVNKYTLQEIADALKVEIEIFENSTPLGMEHLTEDPEKPLIKKDHCKETIEQQKEEIGFLKETINHQWKLLHELSKKRGI